MAALLEVQDIHGGYGEVQILQGASLAVHEGRLTALVGANGAGKTTLMRTIMGLIRPGQGEVRFDGRAVTHDAAHAKAAMGLVLVPEGRQVFTTMSVAENLELGATPPRARPQRRENLARVYELFPRLQERRNQRAGTLSGGEQQMLAVGRGIMAAPRVLMLDELSLGLAPALALQLFEALLRLKGAGLTLLLVEQNVQMALAISDDAYVLARGRTDLAGPSRDVLQNQEVRAAYLGMG